MSDRGDGGNPAAAASSRAQRGIRSLGAGSLAALGMTGFASAIGLVIAMFVLPSHLAAQDDIAASRKRLAEIRRERDRLQQQQERLQGQVHDVRDELTNLERQRESTGRIVGEIERQIGGLTGQLDRSSAELILAGDNLAERRAVLERRAGGGFKRGPPFNLPALLPGRAVGDPP